MHNKFDIAEHFRMGIIGLGPIMHLLMCVMKIVHIKRKSHDVEIVFFLYHEGLLSQREQIISFKRSPNS